MSLDILIFPPEDTQENDTPISSLCSNRMFHVIQQSLNGSITYLQKMYNKTRISKHEAIEFFYSARGIFRNADKLASASDHMHSCSKKRSLHSCSEINGMHMV
jgi:hypothetical protein